MKTTAYIAIFSILWSSLSFGGAASDRLLAALKKNPKPFGTFSVEEGAKKTNTNNARLKKSKLAGPQLLTQAEPNPSSSEVAKDSKQSSSSASSLGSGATPGISPVSLAKPESKRIPPLATNTPESKSSNSSGSSPQDNVPEKQLPGSGGTNTNGGSSKGQSFGLWWPVCIFVDGPEANSQITEMVKMSAACGVNLVPYVRTVSLSDPNNPEQINSLQSQSCNLKEAGIAPKGSSLVLTDKSSTVADEMCGSTEADQNGKVQWSKNVAGCNQLANGASGESRKRAESHKGQGDGFGGFASGEVAVGIVDREGYSEGSVYSHEAIGHGSMGWPNGKEAGNGIGDPNNKNDSSGDHQHGGGYTGIGCAQMRASSIPDPQGFHKFYADKTRYYSHRDDKKMPLGEPVWKSFKDGPDTADLANNKPQGTPRNIQVSDGSSFGGSTSEGAGSFHKKGANGLASNSVGTQRKKIGVTAGDGGSNGGTGKIQRGDDTSDPSGKAVSGGAAGSADPNYKIVANMENSSLNNPELSEGSSGSKSSANANNGSEALVANSTSDSSSGQSLSSLTKTTKGTEDSNGLDPNFFESKKTEKNSGKRGRLVRAGDLPATNNDRKSQDVRSGYLISNRPNRNPASLPKARINSSPSKTERSYGRGMRSQVSFGSGS